MTPFEKASQILSKNLLKNVNKSRFIGPECVNRKRLSLKTFTVTSYESVRNTALSIYKRYEEFSGVKELQAAQEKVAVAGEKLEVLSEERRVAWGKLVEIQNKLKANYALMENTKKSDEQYIKLVKNECDFLRQEKIYEEKYEDVDREERAQFNIFSIAVKNSHEIERIQAEKRKYISLVASIVGAVIGIIGTSMSHYYKVSELNLLVASLSSQNISEQLETNMKMMEHLRQAFSQFEKNYNSVSLIKLCNAISDKLIAMENSVKLLTNKNDIEVVKSGDSQWNPLKSDVLGNFSINGDNMFVKILPTGIICLVGLYILGKIFS